jgi:hypothetical protein
MLCSKEKVADAEVFIWRMRASTGIPNTAGNNRLSQCLYERVDWPGASDQRDDDWFAPIHRAGGIDTLFDHRVTRIYTPRALSTEVMHLNIGEAIVIQMLPKGCDNGFRIHVWYKAEVHLCHRICREHRLCTLALPAASNSTNSRGWFKDLLDLGIYAADIAKEVRHVVLSEK